MLIVGQFELLTGSFSKYISLTCLLCRILQTRPLNRFDARWLKRSGLSKVVTFVIAFFLKSKFIWYSKSAKPFLAQRIIFQHSQLRRTTFLQQEKNFKSYIANYCQTRSFIARIPSFRHRGSTDNLI